jgi:chromosomal replication initiation ATPase DnaA
MKEEFERIVNAVAEAAELRPAQILSRRRFPEIIDARWIAVKLMREEGFYTSRIADLMQMTTRNVNHIIYSVEIRLSNNDRSLEYLLETSRKHLRNSKEISPVCG